MANYASEESFITKYPKMNDLDPGVIDEFLTEANAAIAIELSSFLGVVEASAKGAVLLKHIEMGLAYAAVWGHIKSNDKGGVSKAEFIGAKAEKSLQRVVDWAMGQSSALSTEDILEEATFNMNDIETLEIRPEATS